MMTLEEIKTRNRERARKYREKNRKKYNDYNAEWMRQKRAHQCVEKRRCQVCKAARNGEIIDGGYQPYGDILLRSQIK